MSAAEKKLWLYNTIIVLTYLFAATFLLAVRNMDLKTLAILAVPAPLVLWCAYDNLRKDGIFLVFLLVFSSVATPDLRIPGLPAVRAEQGILLAVLVWSIYSLLAGKKLKLHTSLFPGMFAGFIVFMLLSNFVGVLAGVGATYRDFFEFYRIVIYLGVFLVTASIVQTERDRWRVLKFTCLSLVLPGLVAISQYFNPLKINERYVPRIAPTQYISLINNYFSPRVIGLSSNPNVYAVLAAIGVLISIILLFRTRKVWYLLCCGINMLALLMTKSRTGLVFLVVTCAVYYIIYFCQRVFGDGKLRLRPLQQMLAILIVLLLTGVVGFYVLPDGLVWRLRDLANLSSATSWQSRMVHWQENLKFFYKSPILGIGSAKSIDFRFAPDNEWLLLLRKFGVLGTCWFVLMFAYPVFIYWPTLKKCMLSKIYLSVLSGLAVYMFPAAVFHSFQIMPLVMIIAGLLFSSLEDKFTVLALAGSSKETE